MPVGFEQWRAAVGAWSAKIGTPPSPRICSPWRGWMKRSDPLVYKAYLVHLLALLDVVASVLQRFEKSAKESILGIRTAFDRTATCACTKFRWIAIHLQSLDAAAVRLLSSKRCVHAVAFFSLVAMTLLIVSGDVEQNPGPVEDLVTIDDLAEIQEELVKATDKWFLLGAQLKVSNAILQSLMSTSAQNPEYCLYQVLAYWLTNAPSPTWESLVRALSSNTVAKLNIASEIKERHCIPIKNKEIQKHWKRVMKRCVPTKTVLGRGSYGKVSLWKSTHSDESYAGKKYFLQSDSEDFQSRLFSEITLLGEIHHKNIVQFKGVTFHKEKIVLLMECMHTTLQSYILKDPDTQLDNAWKLKIFYQIACGLGYLHTQKPMIIHRDLTANNVLLDSSLSVAKISDFSNARLLNFTDSSGTHSVPSKRPGTPQYMPPEADNPPYDTPLDIFSFGHLILFTVTEEVLDILPRLYSEGGTTKALPELERREKYLGVAQSKVGENDIVFQMMVKCLSDIPKERPSAETLIKSFQPENHGDDLKIASMAPQMDPVRIKDEQEGHNDLKGNN